MATNNKQVKLAWEEKLFNTIVFLFMITLVPYVWFTVEYLLFTLRINQRRGPRVGNGFRLPRKITVDAWDGPSGYSSAMGVKRRLREYGISCMLGTVPFMRVDKTKNKKTFIVGIYVSPDQHWNADRQARAMGWDVVSPPVRCKRRGSSEANAGRGLWQPSKR